jgi:hypothetical protein
MARLALLALLVLSVGLFLRSPALATHASAPASHGPPGGVYGGHTAQHHPMTLRLTRDGKGLRATFVRVDAGMCSSSPDRTFNATLHPDYSTHAVRVRADGSFADTRPFPGHTQAGEKTPFEAELKGRLGTARAAGTIRLSGPVTDANGNVIDRCDSGTVRWTLRRGSVYAGATADHAGALRIRVDRDGKMLRSFFIDLQFVCDSTIFLFSLDHLNIAVRRDGSFSKRGMSGIRLKGPEGSTVSGQFSLRGKLGLRRASGTYRALGTARSTDGETLDCETGRFRWTARRG